MKKSTLVMACLVGLALMASCKKDIQPTITATAGSGTTLYAGDSVTVGFTANGQALTKIEMNATQNGTVLHSHSTAVTPSADSYNYTHTFSIDAIGTVTVTGIVTDAKGNQATTSFDITCNEKPNAKFVGHYEGDALVSGSYDIEITNMNPIHEEFTDRPFTTLADIVAGENINEVTATIKINDQENTVNGTVEGNKVTFEAINDTYNIPYQGFQVPVSMTYNIVGTLSEGQLQLSGNCTGSGDVNLVFVSGTLALEGTVSGSLNKTE